MPMMQLFSSKQGISKSANELVEEYDWSSPFSGLRLNIAKYRICGLGAQKGVDMTACGVSC